MPSIIYDKSSGDKKTNNVLSVFFFLPCFLHSLAIAPPTERAGGPLPEEAPPPPTPGVEAAEEPEPDPDSAIAGAVWPQEGESNKTLISKRKTTFSESHVVPRYTITNKGGF